MKKLILLTAILVLLISQLNSQNLAQAKSFFEQKKYEEAFKIFNTIKKETDHFSESRYYMGLISMNKKDLTKAEEYLKQAISANSNIAKYHVAIVNVYGQIISQAGKFKQVTLAPTLRTHMEEAIRLNPNDMNTPLMLIGYYMQAPGFMGGGEDKAVELANRISKISKADGFRALGVISQFQKKFPDAEVNYQKALNTSPDSLKFHYSLAYIQQAQNKHEQMVSTYEKAITKFPENNSLLLTAGRAVALSNCKQTEKGTSWLNKYIEKMGKNDKTIADAYYYLGVIAKNENNKTLAKNHFNASLKINPDHVSSLQAIKELK